MKLWKRVEPISDHKGERKGRDWRADHGRSVIEILIVVAIAGILTALSVPQVISARRLTRTNAMWREMAAQMRLARQQAMSQMQAVTFQYDQSAKVVKIIDHNNNFNPNAGCNVTGQQIMADSAYPMTACSRVTLTVPLTGRVGMPASELSYGMPSGVSVTSLADTSTPTALTGNMVNITFQPNGTVIDAGNNFTNKAMFMYNNKAAKETAAAISVLGASGRVKVWRYDLNGNVYGE